MIAIDMDGTLLGADGKVSQRNLAALHAAEAAGVEIVVATGRRHCYAMRQLRGLGLAEKNVLISSNGAVTRSLDAVLMERTLMPRATSEWLCGHLEEFRNALVITFDKVGPDGEDARGALVVEHLDELHSSIDKWMIANEPYIAHIIPLEDALQGDEPIQMMLCGPVERMRRAEARMLESPRVAALGVPHVEGTGIEITLARTEYPDRDLSIVDILPAGCGKGPALLRLAAERGVDAAEILAIGDNWNDLSMLQIAGRSVVMGNAPAELKAMAAEHNWMVGPRHDADGVAEAIEAVLAESSVAALADAP